MNNKTENEIYRRMNKTRGKLAFSLGLLAVLLIGFGFSTQAQSYWWIELKDKKGSAFQLTAPEKFLSERALIRRTRQHIPIDETDLPVSKTYTDSIKKLGFEIVHSSKWLNGLTIRTADTSQISKIRTLSFVKQLQLTKPALQLKSGTDKFSEIQAQTEYAPATYGNALNQLTQLKGDYLHRQGFRGKGVQIAVLDAGFWNVDKIQAFDSLRNSGRIMGIRDFVDPKSNIYQTHTHGMSVLSCMAANLPGSLTGTAPEAAYYLFRTEDAPTEYLVEEDHWVAAAEYADSLGVDLINSSLGYSTFDDPKTNHLYADLNGTKTRVTRAANMAFQKGILVFSSAGNEGNNSWKKIIAPADGTGLIGVGAVDKNGTRATFSSYGPAFGGAVKPNVSALGSSTYLVTSGETIGYSSGTSFSSPVLAGVAACLIQAHPYANASQLKMAIEQSAHQYSKPDSLLGYGIPDFEKADQYLKLNNSGFTENASRIKVSPNPFSGKILIRGIDPNLAVQIKITDLQGKTLWQSQHLNQEQIEVSGLSYLPRGVFLLNLYSGAKNEQVKLIKVN